MKADVVLLPRDLPQEPLGTVVVLDVLRATTSITAALAAGVARIRPFPTIDAARAARALADGFLAGEVECLPPEGFDLGNSPADFAHLPAGATVYFATTNGTRALAAAQRARRVLVGALVNAAEAARHVAAAGEDVVLLCAGTRGQVSLEDAIGAGAILDALRWEQDIDLGSDTALMALGLFRAAADDLAGTLEQSQGGRHVLAAGLPEDIRFAAALNSVPVVGRLEGDSIVRADLPAQ